MNVGELRDALYSGVPLFWQGKREYESARGFCSGIIESKGPSGETVYSCILSTKPKGSITCRPDEVRFWHPEDGAQGA